MTAPPVPPTVGVLGISTPLDRLLGAPLKFMGAHTESKMFLLRDDGGNDLYYQVIVGKNKKGQNIITDIKQLSEDDLPDPLPKALTREEPLGTVILYQYNKQDNLFHAQPAAQEFDAAQWNKGYQFIDVQHGHPWLRVGMHNYTKRPRVRFEYNYVGDDDDEDV